MSEKKLSVVSETNIGLYVWELPEGRYLSDNEGNLLNIPARRGDIARISKLCAAARHYGFPEGNAVFIEGVRRVSDDEHAEQVRRMAAGETPDEYDLGALRDDLRSRRNQN